MNISTTDQYTIFPIRTNYSVLIMNLLLILLSVGCSSEEPWSSSDYFIGSWEFESTTFSCCAECLENYEEECNRVDGPFHAEIIFLENGECYRNWETSGTKDTLAWCYNANTQVLLLKDDDGAFSSIKNTYNIKEIDDASFSAQIFSFMLFRINSFKRK